MQIHPSSDNELIRLLTEGHEGAFQALYAEHSNELYRYARRSIAVSEDCEEIVQDVFVSLWERREKLGDIQHIKAYLFQMVKFKMIRYFQHRKVKKRYEEHFLLFEAVYDNAREDEREPDQLYALLEKCIAALPDRCQVAMRLRLHENLSNGEIAERMQITKKTVEVYMYKAFEHLRANRGVIKGSVDG